MAKNYDRGNESVTDAELVLACRRGDHRAFVEVVARHQAMVCGIALGVLNDFAGSQDAGQEAFLTAWRKIQELREPEKLRAWLAQIARNAALAQARTRRPEEPLDAKHDFADPGQPPDEATAAMEEAEMVRAALDRIPEIYRLPLVLFYHEGQSTRAVAEVLEISDDAARQRLARGREMLRARMEGVVESVLTRARPNAIFTMTIAVAIGALAAPGAIATTVFSASAAGSATAGKTSSILTAMSTTKTVAVTATLLAVAFVPIGYQFGTARPSRGNGTARSQAPVIGLSRPAESHSSFDTSALFAEWRALHEKYGRNAAAMPQIFRAVDQIERPGAQSRVPRGSGGGVGASRSAGRTRFLFTGGAERCPARAIFRGMVQERSEWCD